MSQSGSDKLISASRPKKLSLSEKSAVRDILILTTSADISHEARKKLLSIIQEKIDWQYLLDIAEYHGISPLLAYNLLHNDFTAGIPKPYAEKLSRIYHNSLYKNIVLADELNKILAVFNKNNIPVIVLKGVTMAELLYNNPGLRVTLDIDIIVPSDMISAAKSLLTESGYQPHDVKEPWDHPFHEIPYYKPAQLPVFIELHRNLDDPGLMNIPLQDIWHRAQKVQIQGIPSLVLSSEDTLLYLSNCFSKPSNFNLKTLGDIAELLKKYNGLLDWDYILKSARSWHVHVSLGYALIQARSLLGAPVPEAAIKALKPGFWRNLLLRLLINRDTFISAVKWDKLQMETLVIRNSLMMDRPGQMIAVLSKFRGHKSKVVWFRSVAWIIFVVLAAMGNNLWRLLSGKRQR